MNSRPNWRLFRLALSPVAVLFAALACGPQAFATSVVPPDFDELVNHADYIVRAVVLSVTPELKTRADGSTAIHSKILLQVEQTIAGHPPTPLVLDMLGGKMGDREVRISGAPNYEVGDRAVFFVQGNGTQVHPLVRMMHGFYPVERDAVTGRSFIVRADRSPLLDVRDVSRPLADRAGSIGAAGTRTSDTALTPEQFEGQIRAHVTSAHLREK
ncbi:MAG: hypothetical protein ABIZ04_17075 [Opitutus sp.]